MRLAEQRSKENVNSKQMFTCKGCRKCDRDVEMIFVIKTSGKVIAGKFHISTKMCAWYDFEIYETGAERAKRRKDEVSKIERIIFVFVTRHKIATKKEMKSYWKFISREWNECLLWAWMEIWNFPLEILIFIAKTQSFHIFIR